MTISFANWCPDCSTFINNSNGAICPICESALMHNPQQQQQQTREQTRSVVRLLPTLREVMDDIVPLRNRIQDLASTVPTEMQQVNQINRLNEIFDNDFQTIQNSGDLVHFLQQMAQFITDLRTSLSGIQGSAVTAGVPKDVLARLPRKKLTEQSSILKESSLTWIVSGDTKKNGCTEETKTELPVVPAEFGATQANLQNVRLAVCDTSTRPEDNVDDIRGAVLVLRRGGIPFAQKARLAQQRGAVGLIIVNDRAFPWPYIMTDSTNKAHDITIPVVMVPQGTLFPKNNNNNNNVKVSLKLQEDTDLICCICTEPFCNTTVIQLPKCHHLFHVTCALAWLSKHNTCPYCRSVVHTIDGPST